MRISASRVDAIVQAIFARAGSQPEEARRMAEHLVGANLAGHDSHGVVRIPRYLEYLAKGEVFANRTLTVAFDTPVLAVVDGNMGFGQALGHDAVAVGVAKAKASGIALVGFRNVGHLGRIGAWGELAARSGVISIHFVNTTGSGMRVAPFGSAAARLSTNPITITFPRPGQPPVVFDAATSVMAEGKILVAANKGEKLPDGVLYDASGQPTRDPNALYATPPGALAALGLHKGSGLSIMVDLLAGTLSGGGCTAPEVKVLQNTMTSIYIDPARLPDPDFLVRESARFLDWVKSAPARDADNEVLLPGEPEQRRRAQRLRDGIEIDATTWRELGHAATVIGVDIEQVALTQVG